MSDGYLWIKALHVLAVIAWMAGLFYLPRLYVYHAGLAAGSETSELFKIMERRLLKAIMRPAAAVSIVAGFWVGLGGGWFGDGQWWLWAKLVLVVLMLGFHGLLERHAAEFRADRRRWSGKYFRVINEVPTVLLAGIVVLVVVKPF